MEQGVPPAGRLEGFCWDSWHGGFRPKDLMGPKDGSQGWIGEGGVKRGVRAVRLWEVFGSPPG